MKHKTLLIIAVINYIVQILNIIFLFEAYPMASSIISSIVYLVVCIVVSIDAGISAFAGIGIAMTLIMVIAGVMTGNLIVDYYSTAIFASVILVLAFVGVIVRVGLDKEEEVKK